MKSGGRVEIDISDGSESVTATVKRVLGKHTRIAPEDVQLLETGWVRLRRGETNLYVSPHAVESILVENGELADPR